jgi:hypothetical protein
MSISAKSVRVFSAVEALREGHRDVRQALLPLFRPDICKFNGEVFDPSKVATEINREYRLGVTPEIIAEMIPLFADEGWLEALPTVNNPAYRIVCPIADTEGEDDVFQDRAKEVISEIRRLISELSPLKDIDKTDDQLLDGLVEWLLSIEASSVEDLKTIRKVEYAGNKLVYRTMIVDDKSLSKEEYLYARFVMELVESNSPLAGFIIELASVGLITEVVRDFQKPTSSVKNTSLAVYLDSPVLMDLLGASGRAPQDNVKAILQRLASLGGSVRVFRVSIEEMQTSLYAVLLRPPSHREGPTAEAIRRNEVPEAFLRQLLNSPDGIIKKFDVAILDQNEDAYPNEHKFFTSKDIQDLYADIHWVEDDRPRYHDALVAGLIMRKRAGARGNDIFELKHVLVTQNPHFAPVARRLARQMNYVGPGHVGPVIHQRQLATAVWLRAGLGASDQEVPRRFMLSACQRVLSLHRNLMERVRAEARNLEGVSEELLEMLFTEGRSTQVLLDKTLGAAGVIDASNIGQLISEMKDAVTADAVADAVKVGEQRAQDLEDKVAEAEQESHDLRQALSAQLERNARVGQNLIATVNERGARRRRILAGIAFLLIAGVEAAPLAFGQVGAAITALLVLVTIALHYVGTIRKRVFEPLNAWFDKRALGNQLRLAGLTLGDLSFALEYESGAFKPHPH